MSRLSSIIEANQESLATEKPAINEATIMGVKVSVSYDTLTNSLEVKGLHSRDSAVIYIHADKLQHIIKGGTEVATADFSH